MHHLNVFLLCLWCKVNESPLRSQKLTKCKARSCEQAVWVLKRPLRTLLFSNASPRSPFPLPPSTLFLAESIPPKLHLLLWQQPPSRGTGTIIKKLLLLSVCGWDFSPNLGALIPEHQCHLDTDSVTNTPPFTQINIYVILTYFFIAQLGRNCLRSSTCNFQRLWMTVFCHYEGVRVERVFQEVLKIQWCLLWAPWVKWTPSVDRRGLWFWNMWISISCSFCESRL